MKAIITLLVIIASITIISCVKEKTNNTEAVVIRDITDMHLSQPDLQNITRQYGLDESQWNGAKFRFVDITDVSYNRTYEASIKSEDQWMGNEFDRKKKVKNFYAEVSQILTNTGKEKIGKDNSSIYAPIARELNKLSKSSAQKKIMLIYSDLMENTEDLSFYDDDKLTLLTSDPDTILKYFESQVYMQRLDGIKIYLIYQPENTEADMQYKIVSGFYKTLFESRGATVEITASLY